MKPTDVTYKLIDTNKKEIIQHRHNLLPYYPNEYALRELTQLYSFTGLKIVQNNSETELNHHTDEQTSSKLDKQKKMLTKHLLNQKHKYLKKKEKKRKITENFYHKIRTKNLNIENHHDSEVNQEKIIKPSFHNPKY